MSGKHQSRVALWPLISIGGILLFMVFYLLAAYKYPGGSTVSVNDHGFSWRNNYWCELLGENAKNGDANTGRAYGLLGMIVLSISISIFWWNIPSIVYERSKAIRGFMRYCGMLSMVFASLIFTNWHDGIIYVAVISGTIAFTLLFYELFRNKRDFLSYFGIVCLAFIFANCIIYVSNFGIDFLPLLQKITFVITLSWIILVILQLKKHAYSHPS